MERERERAVPVPLPLPGDSSFLHFMTMGISKFVWK